MILIVSYNTEIVLKGEFSGEYWHGFYILQDNCYEMYTPKKGHFGVFYPFYLPLMDEHQF